MQRLVILTVALPQPLPQGYRNSSWRTPRSHRSLMSSKSSLCMVTLLAVAKTAINLRRTLPSTVFPKNFFCALCSQLAVDSWKLLCCNKVICSSCKCKLCFLHQGDDVLTILIGQANLQFPTTCPSCDHSPLEAGSCVANKALRNTMRVWLEKRKKKEEAKVATQAPTTPVEAAPLSAPLSAGGISVNEAQGKPVESVEESSKVDAGSVDNAPIVMQDAQDPVEGAASTSVQLNEVGSGFAAFSSYMNTLALCDQKNSTEKNCACLRRVNPINNARACDFRV